MRAHSIAGFVLVCCAIALSSPRVAAEESSFDLEAVGAPEVRPLLGFEADRMSATPEGGAWSFRADGTFRFTPAPEGNHGTDLFPVEGRWTREHGIIELHGGRRAPSGGEVRLDGFLVPVGERYRLDLLYQVTPFDRPVVVHVSSDLVPGKGATDSTRRVSGRRAPSRHEGVLEARLAAGLWRASSDGSIEISRSGTRWRLAWDGSTYLLREEPGTGGWRLRGESDGTEGFVRRLEGSDEIFVMTRHPLGDVRVVVGFPDVDEGRGGSS